MKKNVNARIIWIPLDNGGRKKPIPNDTKYCPIISFPENYLLETWSAEIVVIETNAEGESNANLSFLLDEAPFELLKKNVKFQLFEGKRLVATGVVL